MLIKPFDFGIIISGLAVVIASFFFADIGVSSQSGITIKGENGEWIFPLNADETVHVSGPLGETVIEIHDGKAGFLSSPCVNQTCIAAGTIDSQGQWAACLPNRVLLSITGENSGGSGAANENDDVDAAAW